jgi:hypothetical protein
MSGMKVKVAHKRADTEKWSASERAQRKRMIRFLQEMIEELEQPMAEDSAARPAARPAAKRPARKRRRKLVPA